MKTELNYKLTLSEEHMQILWDALELFTHIHMGRWEECALHSKVPIGLLHECKEELDKIAQKFEATPARGTHYGIFNKELPVDAGIAFDMKQVIRHHLSHDRHPEGGRGVDFDNPMHWVKDRPLPTIEDK